MDKLLKDLTRPWIAYLSVALVSIVFYANTFHNQFALDDGLVYTDNKFVTKGLDGIFDIFSYDSFYGTLGEASELNGGRYRPLSQAMLAVEFEFTGITNDKGVKKPDPYVHHVINVICYAIACMLLYMFIRTYVFKDNKLSAWAATILFAIHPIHTEVVANIKSRDELLSIILLISTLYLVLKYAETRKIAILFGGMLSYALALLAKENGLMFILIIPLTLYFLGNKPTSFILRTTIPFFMIVLGYMTLRYHLLGFKNGTVQEIMDNPYVRATFSEKYGTIMYVLLCYLRLLFWPNPLTYDYSFNQIPYRTLTNPVVLFSLALHIGFLVYVVMNWKEKHLLAYCILFYLLSMFIVSNIVINVGAPMGERFLFQSSVAFVIALVYLFNRLSIYLKGNQNIIGLVLLIILGGAAYAKTVARNEVWHDGNRLGLIDVKVSVNSARANTYAGTDLINISDTIKDTTERRQKLLHALEYFRRAIRIQPKYITIYQNMGVAYHRLGVYDSAAMAWDEVKKIDPKNNNLKMYEASLASYKHNKIYKMHDIYFKKGLDFGAKKCFDSSILYFKRAIESAPPTAEDYYNLGGAYFSAGRYQRAREYWTKCLKINPKNAEAQKGIEFMNQTHK